MNRLAEIHQELNALELRRLELLEEQRCLLIDSKQKEQTYSPSEKIALFLSLFACRLDVYPRFWENERDGRKGYSPVCANEWSRLVCEKPRIKCSMCMHQAFPPLDEVAVRNHLTGKSIIGTYAIREDHKCIFLAADFDEGEWQRDILAFRKAAEEMGIEVAMERSRSGNGGHAWIFFTEPVPAAIARKIGTLILSRSLAENPFLDMKSYDRFFPNQDKLPSGGFGNLIALPLQEVARKKSNSVFVDEDMIAYPDQWEFLAQVEKVSPTKLDQIIGSVHQEHLENDQIEQKTFEDKTLDQIAGKLTKSLAVGRTKAVLAAQLNIGVTNLPRPLIAALKRLAMFPNPIFFQKQAMRLPTYEVPRFIFAGELQKEQIVLPRTCVASAKSLFREAGGKLEIEDLRSQNSPITLTFHGELTMAQTIAVEAAVPHEHAVLLAPPGAGKTVMACALIAKRQVRTLVLVHRKPLLEQWQKRLRDFLNADKHDAFIKVVMIQSFLKHPAPSTLFEGYDQVVIDECHHVPAVSFEAVMKECTCRFILGLSATPVRKDGMQKLLYLQCGPIRHRMEMDRCEGLKRNLYLRHISLNRETERMMPLHELWELIAHHEERNKLILADIVQAIRDHRHSTVLSDRKEHLQILQDLLRATLPDSDHNIFYLVGSLSAKARKAEMQHIEACAESGAPFTLFATSALLGEGFDLPILDTVFLTFPVSFRGRLVQYAGRIHRPMLGKTECRIYDYAEDDIPVTSSMLSKRMKVYRELGYELLDC